MIHCDTPPLHRIRMNIDDKTNPNDFGGRMSRINHFNRYDQRETRDPGSGSSSGICTPRFISAQSFPPSSLRQRRSEPQGFRYRHSVPPSLLPTPDPAFDLVTYEINVFSRRQSSEVLPSNHFRAWQQSTSMRSPEPEQNYEELKFKYNRNGGFIHAHLSSQQGERL